MNSVGARRPPTTAEASKRRNLNFNKNTQYYNSN